MENQPNTITPDTQPPDYTPPTQSPLSNAAPTPPPQIKHAHKFIFGYIALIVLIAAVAGVYSWQHKKASGLETQVANLNSQVSKLNKQVKSLQGTTKQSQTNATKSASASGSTVFKIPELSIEITVPNAIKDIVYQVNPASTLSTGQQSQSVTLTTQTLVNLDAGCSVNGPSPPLGTLSKTTGQYPSSPDVTSDNVSGALIKQFPTYYIAWAHPQGACSSSTSTQNAAGTDTSLFSTALHAAVQPIQ